MIPAGQVRLADGLRHWAERTPDQPALSDDGTAWTYAQLQARVDEAAAFLRRDPVARRVLQGRPGKMVQVADRSRDGRHVVLDVDAADQPSQLYHLDTVKGTAELLDDAAPWLAAVPALVGAP